MKKVSAPVSLVTGDQRIELALVRLEAEDAEVPTSRQPVALQATPGPDVSEDQGMALVHGRKTCVEEYVQSTHDGLLPLPDGKHRRFAVGYIVFGEPAAEPLVGHEEFARLPLVLLESDETGGGAAEGRQGGPPSRIPGDPRQTR